MTDLDAHTGPFHIEHRLRDGTWTRHRYPPEFYNLGGAIDAVLRLSERGRVFSADFRIVLDGKRIYGAHEHLAAGGTALL